VSRPPSDATPPLHADTRALLLAWAVADEAQARLRDEYVAFLDAHPDATWRTCAAGHITGSALVVDPIGGRVLLTLHPKVGRWLQMGGHLEPEDATLRAAALREAVEESGIAELTLSAWPLRLDRHRGHCRRDLPEDRWPDHLDVQFLAVADPDAVERVSAESLDLRWFAWDEVDALADTDDALRRLVAAARAFLAA
jgi:8-oxo-dGTP pyrophosphatase MutT (NUDIX family)